MIAHEITTKLDMLQGMFPQNNSKQVLADGEILPGFEQRVNIYSEIYSLYDPSLSQIDNEIKILRHFMESANLYTRQDIFEVMKSSKDNIFEIYRFDYSQLYRSYSFMKFKTYSVVELMNYANSHLYQREDKYTRMIEADVTECVTEEKLHKFNVPVHKVWEKHNRTFPDCHWVMNLGVCCPVYDADINQMVGFFASHHTEQVFMPPFVDVPRPREKSVE